MTSIPPRLAGALGALLALAACDRANPPARVTAAFNGTWVDCSSDGVADHRDVIAIGGGRLAVQSFTYDTADGSCGGTGTTDGSIPFSFTARGEIAAAFGAGTVTATAVDEVQAASPFEVLYTILWRDAAAEPDVLYLGDPAATPGLDGTAAEKRPAALDANRVFYLQSIPVASELTGTWRVACHNDAGGDRWEELTITPSSMSDEEATYTSTDGTCTGSVVAWSMYHSMLTLGAPVYATLGTRTVTALELDTDGTYSIAWVDESVTPPVLYRGDPSSTAGYDASTAGARPTVLDGAKPAVKQ